MSSRQKIKRIQNFKIVVLAIIVYHRVHGMIKINLNRIIGCDDVLQLTIISEYNRVRSDDLSELIRLSFK